MWISVWAPSKPMHSQRPTKRPNEPLYLLLDSFGTPRSYPTSHASPMWMPKPLEFPKSFQLDQDFVSQRDFVFQDHRLQSKPATTVCFPLVSVNAGARTSPCGLEMKRRRVIIQGPGQKWTSQRNTLHYFGLSANPEGGRESGGAKDQGSAPSLLLFLLQKCEILSLSRDS